MKKTDKRDKINLFFSAFLMLAFIVCAHFFSQFTATLDKTLGTLITIVVFAVFGLLVFYATRVGDGKAIKRFSAATLIVLDIPMLYIIVASLAPGLPLHDVFVGTNTFSVNGLSAIVTLASIALGYGIPYTFLSGFEIANEDVVEEEPEMLEGGLEADLSDAYEEAADEAEEADAETEITDEAEVEEAENTQEDAQEDTQEDTEEDAEEDAQNEESDAE